MNKMALCGLLNEKKFFGICTDTTGSMTGVDKGFSLITYRSISSFSLILQSRFSMIDEMIDRAFGDAPQERVRGFKVLSNTLWVGLPAGDTFLNSTTAQLGKRCFQPKQRLPQMHSVKNSGPTQLKVERTTPSL